MKVPQPKSTVVFTAFIMHINKCGTTLKPSQTTDIWHSRQPEIMA